MMRSNLINDTESGSYQIIEGKNKLSLVKYTKNPPFGSYIVFGNEFPIIFIKNPKTLSIAHFNLNSSKDFFKVHFNLSQEEIDALMKELEEAKIHALNYNGAAPVPIEFEPNGNVADPWYFGTVYEPKTDKAKCFHKWKLYTGLVEQFEYCEICNVKK